MLLTNRQARDLLLKHGIFAREICDKCGVVLGAVRFTRRDEASVWCSPLCRGDGERVIRKGGRPRKYRTDRARLNAEKTQSAERQKSFRVRVQRNGKPPCTFTETKDLQTQKSPLSTIPLTPLFPVLETAHGE